MDNNKTATFVNDAWDESIIPEIAEYIKIPNKSPSFDPDWEANGHMEQAVLMLEAWAQKQPIQGMQIEIVRIDGRTPLLFIDIPGASDDVVLLYGHYDKQPEFSGWDDDLDPWTPVIKDGKLYGRGGADDGYATFGSLTAMASRTRTALSLSRAVRKAAVSICPSTSISSKIESAHRASWFASMPSVATTINCGAQHRYAATSQAHCVPTS